MRGGWWQISRMPPPTRWGASFTAGRGLAHKGISSAEGRAVPWGAVRLSLGVICTRARRSAAMGRGVAVRAGKGARRGVAKGWPRDERPRGSRGASKRVAKGPNGEIERPAAGPRTERAGSFPLPRDESLGRFSAGLAHIWRTGLAHMRRDENRPRRKTRLDLLKCCGAPSGIRTRDIHLERVASLAARRWGQRERV